MNFTNSYFEGEYTITSKNDLLKHVRIAKHFDDKDGKTDTFAINYSH